MANLIKEPTKAKVNCEMAENELKHVYTLHERHPSTPIVCLLIHDLSRRKGT
jgi:hypothetical protein